MTLSSWYGTRPMHFVRAFGTFGSMTSDTYTYPSADGLARPKYRNKGTGQLTEDWISESKFPVKSSSQIEWQRRTATMRPSISWSFALLYPKVTLNQS